MVGSPLHDGLERLEAEALPSRRADVAVSVGVQVDLCLGRDVPGDVFDAVAVVVLRAGRLHDEVRHWLILTPRALGEHLAEGGVHEVGALALATSTDQEVEPCGGHGAGDVVPLRRVHTQRHVLDVVVVLGKNSSFRFCSEGTMSVSNSWKFSTEHGGQVGRLVHRVEHGGLTLPPATGVRRDGGPSDDVAQALTGLAAEGVVGRSRHPARRCWVRRPRCRRR